VRLLLNHRSKLVLDQLLMKNKSLKVQDIAKQLNISSRTVRYDLDAIDEFLAERKFTILDRSSKGISFKGSEEEKERILEIFNKIPVQTNILMPMERLYQIMYLLLTADNYLTIGKIAERLYVSKSTIINDIQKIKEYYPYQNAVFESVPHYGIRITGDEKNIRKSIVFFLSNNIGVKEISELLGKHERTILSKSSLSFMFNDICLNIVSIYVKKICEHFDVKLMDSEYINLLLHFAVMIMRIKAGFALKYISFEDNNQVKPDHIVKLIVQEIEVDFEIELPEEEYFYINSCIFDIIENISSTIVQNNQIEQQVVSLNFIKEVKCKLGGDLIQESYFMETLNTNIQAILNRKADFICLQEAVYQQIIDLNEDIYFAVDQSAYIIEEYTKRKLLKSEKIQLMVIFIEAVQYHKNTNNQKPKVLVICSSGQSISRLLSYRLNSIFDIDIINVIAFHQLDKHLKSNHIDYIISTVAMDNVNVDYFEVTPFLSKNDIGRLKQHLPTKVIDYALFYKLLDIIQENCKVIDKNKLLKQLVGLLNIEYYQPAKDKPKLCEALKRTNIMLDVVCENWREAVIKSGEILLKYGYIKESYISAMVAGVEENGYYIVISKGIALPHAYSVQGVNKIGMCLLRLKNPVEFGNQHNDPVDLIFAFSSFDNSTHLEVLRQFSLLIGDESKLEIIRKASSTEEIINLIEEVSML